MTDELREALERAQGDPPPWRHTVDDFVAAGRRQERRRRARVVVGSSVLTAVAAAGLLIGPGLPEWLRPHGAPSMPSRLAPAAPPSPTPPSPTPDDTGGSAPTTPSWYSGPPRCVITSSPDDFGTTPEWKAYVDAGYTYDEATLLARLWGKGTDVAAAKVCMGGELLHGRQLPIRPGQTARTVSPDAALQAYTNNGYTSADAATLAELWSLPAGDPSAVKVRAGRMILDGQTLPLRP